MHLLVLSAFRHEHHGRSQFRHKVSMHLLVLSAFRPVGLRPTLAFGLHVSMHLLVLSAFRRYSRCNSTMMGDSVSMHLLVLSAFRLESTRTGVRISVKFQCTFWCSVLSDQAEGDVPPGPRGFNAPFGAQCFPTAQDPNPEPPYQGFNAPFGAQCFPTKIWNEIEASWSIVFQCTFWCSVLSDRKSARRTATDSGFNAPFGAQCFPTQACWQWYQKFPVSMHLLVLSAFRPDRVHPRHHR